VITRRTAISWIGAAAGAAAAGPGLVARLLAAGAGPAPPLGSQAALAALPSRWLYHAATGGFWPVDDVGAWIAMHRGDPLLERAHAGLVKSDDPDHWLTLVLRRCGLQYLEIDLPPGGDDPPGHEPARAGVSVHHWSTKHGDLRPLFKGLGLAHNGIDVTLVNRKSDAVRHARGGDFCYGEPSDDGPDPAVLAVRWARRHAPPGPPDWSPATTRNWFIAWPEFKGPGIPWVALEDAWRTVESPACLNCDRPTILTGFGIQPHGWFSGRRLCEFTCLPCGRRQEEKIDDLNAWFEAHLHPDYLPVKRWA